MTLSDRVAVILDGELLQVAPPREIYADPKERLVAEFIGSPKINVIEGRVREQGVIEVGDTTLAVRAGHGVLSGRVRLVEYLGSDIYAHLDWPGQSEKLVVRVNAEHARSARSFI